MKFSLITFALLCVGSIYAQKDIDKMEPFISFYFEKKNDDYCMLYRDGDMVDTIKGEIRDGLFIFHYCKSSYLITNLKRKWKFIPIWWNTFLTTEKEEYIPVGNVIIISDMDSVVVEGESTAYSGVKIIRGKKRNMKLKNLNIKDYCK